MRRTGLGAGVAVIGLARAARRGKRFDAVTVTIVRGPNARRLVAAETLGAGLAALVEERATCPTAIFRRRGDEDVIDAMTLVSLAASVARDLAAAGVGVGSRVVLAWDTSPTFLASFWACQLLGAVAVPAPAPHAGRALTREMERLTSIVKRVGPTALSCSATTAELVRPLLSLVRAVVSEPDDTEPWDGGFADVDPASPAVVQFTSGSTTEPRGCVLTHAAIVENVEQVARRLGVDHAQRGVNWCPLFHDMGLVGSVLLPVLAQQLVAVQLAPEQFVTSPLSWLRALSDHRAEISAAPSFAFALVARRLERGVPDGIDLSNVRSIFCGAEPIDPDAVRMFLERTAPLGLRPSAFHAAYGLAEAVVLLTSKPGGLRTRHVDRADIDRGVGCEVEEADATVEIVSVGTPVGGASVRVVDEGGHLCADGLIGDIEVRSPSLTTGYYDDSDATEALFASDGWLRTGDVGGLIDGELHLVGRRKDVVILGGRNIFCCDVEHVVSGVDGVRYGGIAAFGVESGAAGERLVVLVEARAKSADALAVAVRSECMRRLGVAPEVVIVAPGSLPRTSSGKIQRGVARDAHLASHR